MGVVFIPPFLARGHPDKLKIESMNLMIRGARNSEQQGSSTTDPKQCRRNQTQILLTKMQAYTISLPGAMQWVSSYLSHWKWNATKMRPNHSQSENIWYL